MTISEKQCNAMKYATFCLLFLFGAFFIPDCFMNRHVTAGVSCVAIISAILALLALIYGKKIQFTHCNLLIVLFTIFWVLSQYLGNWLSIQNQIYYLTFCTLIFVLGNWRFDRKIIEKYYFIALIIALFISLWGIAQYFDLVKVFHNDFPVTGNFDNPAGIGIFLAALFPFCLFQIKNRQKSVKIGAICILVILIATILLSQSRTALLAVFIISVFELFSIVKISKHVTHKRIFIVIALIISLTILYLMYNWKVDSANGRLFIWQISWEMFLDNWLIGSGAGSFQAKYMLYQAEYFRLNPQSEFVRLADNVLHPFNEYLKLLIEYGIIGFSIIVSYILLLIGQYRKFRFNQTIRPIFLSLAVIAVSALFSYSFKYPAITTVLVINLGIVNSLCFGKSCIKRTFVVYALKITILPFVLLLIYLTINEVIAQRIWYKAAHRSLIEAREENISTYIEVGKWLKYDALFLYNFGAELNYIGKHIESNKVLLQCSKFFNDMDVQMLIADNHFNLKNYNDAEQHLLLASNMCPVRFLPLYKLFLLYVETGQVSKSVDMGEQIVNKSAKIPSSTIKYIKKDVQQKLASF